ncbi:MAG: DUF1214 domain-containing protein [Rhodobacteraceae bacterium]|nr:DUF1214 domain-containing protein [Paracoccaceae bacterium]
MSARGYGDARADGLARHYQGRTLRTRCADAGDPERRCRGRHEDGPCPALRRQASGHAVLSGPQLAQCAQRRECRVHGADLPQRGRAGRHVHHRLFDQPGDGAEHGRRGSKYPFAYRDADGNHLSGGSSYRLHLPPDVPAENFWSVTLYDAETASGLQNGQPYPSIGSNDDLTYNADGSVDLISGQTVPPGRPKPTSCAPSRARDGLR